MKKIKLNSKLPNDYIKLMKEKLNLMQKIKLNKKLQLWNCATSGQTYLLQKIKSFFKVLLTVNLCF